MYLKSTHSQLVDGGHQWEITLFCHTEANSIIHVDILPKSKSSKVVPNDAKPAPTAYTMTYTTSSRQEVPPVKFTATITLKNNEKKVVSVPANMATDRKRRKADGLTDDEDGSDDRTGDNRDGFATEKPPITQEEPIKRKRGFCAVLCTGKSSSKELSEKDAENAPGCCCVI
ncbi:9426_t:CDS:1, partial [Acaulospora morrowiae]